MQTEISCREEGGRGGMIDGEGGGDVDQIEGVGCYCMSSQHVEDGVED